MWPLTGRTAGSPASSRPAMAGRPGPGRQDDVVRRKAAAVRQDELGTGLHGGHGALDECDAGCAAGLHQRAEQGAVVDLVVARHLDAAAQRGAQRGHEGAALARTPALGMQAERVLVGEQVVEAGPVGGIERHGHRARWCRSRWGARPPSRGASAKAGQRRAPSRRSAVSADSPNCASVTGASMPAATHEAPSRPGAGATSVTS